MPKREDYISWNEYFMGIAILSAKRSKDPNTQVGACIVNDNNRIMSVGYNGFPTGCSDDEFPWERSGDELDTKYPYVCHAELNAILNSRSANLDNCRLYVTHFPCNECAKAIIQSGIKKVYYISDKHADSKATMASKKMFDAAEIIVKKLVADCEDIVLSFNPDNF